MTHKIYIGIVTGQNTNTTLGFGNGYAAKNSAMNIASTELNSGAKVVHVVIMCMETYGAYYSHVISEFNVYP